MKQFNPYSAGAKHYGGGRSMPSIGPNSKVGYRYRDNKAKARRNAVLRRMKAVQRGTAYMNRGGV